MGVCDSYRGDKETKNPGPDINYDFLIEKGIQKDGLVIYKPRQRIHSSSQIKCPLCKLPLSEEEYSIINNKLELINEIKLSDLITKFNLAVESPYEIDNINDLEIIYNQISECAEVIEDNRYYKHICINNELCQRTDNQEIYIDLCSISNLDNLNNKLAVDIYKLKTDENYKNNYLNKKEKIHNIYIKKEKKRQIEDKYRSEFEKKCFDKDQYEFERITMNIKQLYESELARNKNDTPNIPNLLPYRNKPNPYFYYNSNQYYFKYSGTKAKLKKFIENLTGEIMYDSNIFMDKWEYKEFQKFILEREPEYEELINIE